VEDGSRKTEDGRRRTADGIRRTEILLRVQRIDGEDDGESKADNALRVAGVARAREAMLFGCL
jgi:hypothetical protein